MVKVSVIIPVYNLVGYVDKCIKSLKNQTFSDFEVVVINDGSKDNSLEVVNNEIGNDTRFTVVTKPNGGLVSARKTGLDLSKGEYIYHLDGDDYIEPDALELMYNKAIETSADMVLIDYIEENGEKSYTTPTLKFDVITGLKFLEILIVEHEPHAIWRNLHKRTLYDENFLFFEHINYGEDCIMTYQLAHRASRVASCKDRPLYHYVYRSGSIFNSSIQKPQQEYMMRYIQKTIDIMESYGVVSQKLIEHFTIFSYSCIFQHGCRANCFKMFNVSQRIFKSGVINEHKHLINREFLKLLQSYWGVYAPNLFFKYRWFLQYFRNDISRPIGRLIKNNR